MGIPKLTPTQKENIYAAMVVAFLIVLAVI